MSRALVPLALLILVAACAPAGTVGSAAPAPKASSSAAIMSSPVATPTRLNGVAKLLDPGTYVFDNALPHVTLQVPSDWYLSEAMPRHFGLHRDDVLVDESVRIWYDMRVASKDPSCPEVPESGIGHGATDLVAAFTADSRLDSTAPKPVAIGGLSGHVIDVSRAPDWTAACPFTDGVASVPLFLDDNVADEPAFWGVSGPERLRLMVLDDRHSSNIVVMLDSTSGSTLDELEATAMPVLRSFRFQIGS